MAIDSSDSSARFSSLTDFIVRQQTPTLLQTLFVFLTTLLMSLGMTVLRLDKIALIIFLFLLIGIIGSYMIVLLQRSRDLVLTTEFQNSLFASALDYSYTFCIIIRNDGHIVYMDRSFHNLFNGFVKQTTLSLTSFLRYSKTDKAEEEKIFSAVDRNTAEKVVCTLVSSDNQSHKLVVSIEPIPRPSGFIMLRAREYIDHRSGASKDPSASLDSPLLSKNNVALFSTIISKMHSGVYMVDSTGNLVFSNAILEQWLSYSEGEFSKATVSIKDIVQYDSSKTGTIIPGDFEGEITLKKKDGGLLRSFINQKVIRDEANNSLGCLALVSLVAETDADVKKYLW